MTSRQEHIMPPLYWPCPTSERTPVYRRARLRADHPLLKPTWRPQIRSYQAESDRS